MRTRRAAFRSLLLVAAAACGGGALQPPHDPATAARPKVPGDCGALSGDTCTRAKGMLAAAGAFSNVKHEYILDPTSSFAPGRGLRRDGAGTWTAIPTECARAHAPSASRSVDAATVDFGFVGVSIDSVLLSADADVTPFFSAGTAGGVHTLRLVAVAFVRDLDPQFFDASDDVTYDGTGCACRGASHFVGAVKMGGMLAYEMSVKEGDVHLKALDLVKARLAARGATVTETRIGGIEVDGLDDALGPGAAQKPLTFHVKNPVPIAYAVYPVADVCKFAFPEPDVSPSPVDFGEAPYGTPITRQLHVVNRAPFDVVGTLGSRTFDVGAHGSVDVPLSWVPAGDGRACDTQTREESLVFAPRSPTTPAVPARQSVPLVEHLQSGRGAVVRAEHIDTGARRSPDYAATTRDWTCPADYVVSACRTQAESCGEGGCGEGGYKITADQTRDGCHFGCTGPTSLLLGSNYCRFDAVMECKLACSHDGRKATP